MTSREWIDLAILFVNGIVAVVMAYLAYREKMIEIRNRAEIERQRRAREKRYGA